MKTQLFVAVSLMLAVISPTFGADASPEAAPAEEAPAVEATEDTASPTTNAANAETEAEPKKESESVSEYQNHPYPVIRMDTKHGPVFAELYPDVAPKHAERIKALAGQGFYDGILFHRVVPGFVAQAGDPKSKGMAPGSYRIQGDAIGGVGSGGSDLPDLPLEVSPKQENTRGALAMARTSDPNSANSQFYVVLQDAPFLNMQYTVFGRVLGDSMKVVDQIKIGDAIEKMTVVKP